MATKHEVLKLAADAITASEARHGLRAWPEYGIEMVAIGRVARIALHEEWDGTGFRARWQLVRVNWDGVGAVSRFRDWWEAQPPTYFARRNAPSVPHDTDYITDTKGT